MNLLTYQMPLTAWMLHLEGIYPCLEAWGEPTGHVTPSYVSTLITISATNLRYCPWMPSKKNNLISHICFTSSINPLIVVSIWQRWAWSVKLECEWRCLACCSKSWDVNLFSSADCSYPLIVSDERLKSRMLNLITVWCQTYTFPSGVSRARSTSSYN